LNDRGFAFAYRGFAFSDTAGKANSEYERANRHEKFLHEESPPV
jgi:hypothetical protein